MVQDHHLQLRSCPPLSHNFWQFNVKAAEACHPIFQKEVDKLLAKGGNRTIFWWCWFLFSVFVVPKCMTGLWHILNLSHLFIICLYLPLRCRLSDMFSSLFNTVIMHSPLVTRMLIYTFLLLSIIIIFLQYALHNMPYQWKVLLLAWSQPLGFSGSSLNLSCSFAITSISVLLSIWMTAWSWFALKGQIRGLPYFCALYWSALDYILMFLSLTFTSLRHFVFWGLCWDTVHMSISLPPDKLAHIHQLCLSLLQTQSVKSPSGDVLFRQGQFLCQWPLPSVDIVSCHSE